MKIAALAAAFATRVSKIAAVPAPPKSYYDFARTMRLPDGPMAGQLWDPRSEPAQRIFLEACDSGKYTHFVVVAPSQRGKTLKGILMPTLRALIEERQSVAFIMPTLDKLNQNYQGKIKPMIEGSGYGSWLPKSGPGSQGGRPSAIVIREPETGVRAGLLYFMATGKGSSETGTAAVSTKYVDLDEGDDVESYGDIQLVFKRIDSFGLAGRCFVASTVNDRGEREDHPILQAYADTTKTRIGHKCPHCDVIQVLSFEQLTESGIACSGCGVVWSEIDRHLALNNAVAVHDGVVGSTPDNLKFGLLTTGLDYHMAVIPGIYANMVQAKQAEVKGDLSLMRLFCHKVKCEKYVEPIAAGEISHKWIATMSMGSDYSKGTVPAWALFLTMAVDVQEDRHYWGCIAHGPDDRWAYVDWGYIMLAPEGPTGDPLRPHTPQDRRRVNDDIRDMADRGWLIEGGSRRMSPVQRCIDIGYLPDELVAWIQGEPAWKAVRGVGADEAKKSTYQGREIPLHNDLTRTGKVRATIPEGWSIVRYHIDGHIYRRAAHASLLRKPDQPASGMVPRNVKSNDYLALHLSARVWVEAEEKVGQKAGKPAYWRENRRREDLLDVLIYALAMADLHRLLPERRDDGGVIMPLQQAEPTRDQAWLGDLGTDWALQ